MDPSRPLVFGTQYYRAPNPPRSDWSRDLARIREHGMNTVKFWASWSWMHRAPGEVTFDELDELMDLAAEHELDVVVNTILENAPYWLEREAPEARYVADDGRVVQLTAAINTPGGGWPGLCFDNERARSAATEFLTAVVERYRGHPALAVWDVWNEPHIEPTWYYPDKLFCYCDASQQTFRSWLRSRYGSVAAVNNAWLRRYSSWDEVQPPRVAETFPDLLDWREFWLDNLRAWLEWKSGVVRELDADHPVMMHVASSAYLGTLTTNGWDEWTLAAPVDVFGTSSFPLWLMNDDHVVHLFHLEMTRDAADGKPWWQAELQGGRGRREGAQSTPHPDAGHISLWIWNALAAGASGIVFWQWRPELLGPEAPGYGLCTPAGNPTPRTRAAAEMAALLAQFPELAEARPEPPKTAILVSRKSPLIAHASERTMELYAGALLGAYRAFVDANVPIGFRHEDAVAGEGVSEEVQRLYWPMPAFASAPLARTLREFVERGGTLIVEGSPAAYTEHGWHSAHVPGHALAELLGAEVAETDVVVDPRISTHGAHIRGAWTVDRVTPTTGTVVGTLADGSPAIVAASAGSGITTFIGTFPSLAYERTRDAETGRWIASLALPRSAPELPSMPIVRRLCASTVDLVVAINWSDRDARTLIDGDLVRASNGIRQTSAGIEIDLPPRQGAIAAVAREVVTGTSYATAVTHSTSEKEES